MSPSVSWPVLGNARTLRDDVYEAIRQRLLEGVLKSGTFLRETELGDAMGVSRTPVREALGRLASEGFLVRIPHRGFRVPQRSMVELMHLYAVLQVLEVLAGELAFPHLGEAELESMEEANRAFSQALERNDTATAVRMNERYHQVVSDRCGNPVLRELLEEFRGQIRRLEFVDFAHALEEVSNGIRRRWIRQHQDMIDAVRRGDFEGAKRILYENRSIASLTEADLLTEASSHQGAGS